MPYFIGIDFGTSGARLIVIDQARNLCWQTAARFELLEAGYLPDCWRSQLFSLLSQVPMEYRWETAAIAIDGTSSTVLLCDQSGMPITEPLLYNDARAAAGLKVLQSIWAGDRKPELPGTAAVMSATSSLVKLIWWQQQPYFTQARYLMHQADWLAYLLHGQPGISDYHNSLKLGYDVLHLCYPQWIRDLPIFPLLPDVIAPGQVIGTVMPDVAQQLALPFDCWICAGTTDSIAAFLASGASVPGEAVTSLGSTLALKLLSQTPVENEPYGIYSHRLGDLWLVGGASNTGGAVLQQFFTTDQLIELSAQILTEQASQLDYYPLIKPGERFPINDPNLLPRLEPRPQDAVCFLHGLLESMARIEARGYQLLQALGATPLTRVYTAGGGAANQAWTEIRARQLGVPVVPSPQTEAAYGAALLAANCKES